MKKQKIAVGCLRSEFSCADGSCVQLHRKCNGVRDCPDGSDETLAECFQG